MALTGTDELDPELEQTLRALLLLEDAELWQVARRRLSASEAASLARLSRKKQSVGLTPREAETGVALLKKYDRFMLLRAQAAFLLKQRGFDVSAILKLT